MNIANTAPPRPSWGIVIEDLVHGDLVRYGMQLNPGIPEGTIREAVRELTHRLAARQRNTLRILQETAR